MKKRIIGIALAIFVVLSAFGGGNQSPAPSSQDSSAPLEVTWFAELTPGIAQVVTNLGETPFAQELMRRTNTQIEFQHPAAGQLNQAFNLMVASGDLTDIIEYDILGRYPGGPEKAIEDGVIVDLTDLLPVHAPNLWKFYQENPDIAKLARTDSGKYYSFPFIRGHESLVVYFGPIVNSKWLADLGMAYPETIADWETMLTRFKNEKGATAPLTYEPALLESNNSTFVGAFGVNFDFYLDNNRQIQYGPIQPGYRQFLETFQRWYANGLIDPNIESMNREQTTFKMTTGQAGASLGYAASRLGVWLSAVKDNPEIDFTGTKYPVLNRGDIPMFSQMDFPLQGSIGDAHISTAAKDVVGILKLLDYGYSEEGNMFYNFGIEGVSYEMIDGYPTYTDLLMNDPNLPRAAMFGQYLRSSSNGPFVQRREYFEQYGYQFPQQEVALPNWAVTDVMNHKLPPISPTPEESAELATIMSDINTYRDEMRTKYIMGIENLNTFDTYVRNIQNMGLNRAIEIYTNALRRFNAR